MVKPYFTRLFRKNSNMAPSCVVAVGFFGMAVALVFGQDVPDRGALLSDAGHHLFGFGQRHAGVVLPCYTSMGLVMF